MAEPPARRSGQAPSSRPRQKTADTNLSVGIGALGLSVDEGDPLICGTSSTRTRIDSGSSDGSSAYYTPREAPPTGRVTRAREVTLERLSESAAEAEPEPEPETETESEQFDSRQTSSVNVIRTELSREHSAGSTSTTQTQSPFGLTEFDLPHSDLDVLTKTDAAVTIQAAARGRQVRRGATLQQGSTQAARLRLESEYELAKVDAAHLRKLRTDEHAMQKARRIKCCDLVVRDGDGLPDFKQAVLKLMDDTNELSWTWKTRCRCCGLPPAGDRYSIRFEKTDDQGVDAGFRVTEISRGGGERALLIKAPDSETHRQWVDALKARVDAAEAEIEWKQLKSAEWKDLAPGAGQRPMEAINAPGHWDIMISYTQRNSVSETLAHALYGVFVRRGLQVWLDVKMDHRNEEAMQEGVKLSRCVVAIVSGPASSQPSDDTAYFQRDFCLQELRWAVEAKLPIQPVVAAEDKQKITEFLSAIPADLHQLKDVDWVHIDRKDNEYFEVGVTKILRGVGLEQSQTQPTPQSEP